MSARAIQHQEAIASETVVQHGIRDSAVIPTGTRRVNMIGTTEIRSGQRRERAKEQEQFHAKTNALTAAARIAIKAKDRIVFVDPIDVVVAKGQGNYVGLVHKCGCYLVRETMATAEQKLTPLGFLRIHRSILVNTALVKDLRRDNTGTYLLRTTDGSEHPVGRAYKGNLKMIAKSWLGVDLD
jgi:DNA-binding LytR/AlgR family response regulator